MNQLVFINGLGPNYKGDNMYEFIYCKNIEEVWDDSWQSKPANGYPKPPELDFISQVGTLKNTAVELELIQNSDFFSFMDAMDKVIALGWEKENDIIDFTITKRLVFHFGDTEQEVKDKLYERDVVLEFEKKMQHEK